MPLFKKSSKNFLEHLVKVPFKKDNSLHFLNATQFSVVLIDNIFKLVISFFLIDKIGKDRASEILAFVGAIYVIPFLLFSSFGGILADRFSKQRITVAIKLFEIFIILYSFLAFYQGSVFGAYAVLFLLSVESAIFGPSKYGIIADLVSKEEIAKGNGLITSFTYLAIITGTFFGSFLTEITSHGYLTISAILLALSCISFCFTFAIRYTQPRGSAKKISFFFLKEIQRTLQYTRTKPHLNLAIGGASFFLFIGAFTQLNIIPYAISAMNLGEVAGGYLFLSTAMGIAIGSILSGKLCKKKVSLLLPLGAGFLLSLFLLFLKFTPHSLIATVATLVLLGISGGMFIVPFDTFIQISASDEARGQVIGATNFFGFVCVLLASLSLYVFSNLLFLKPASGFFLMGTLTFLFSLFLTFRLSDYSLKLLSKFYFNPFVTLSYENKALLEKKPIFVAATRNFKHLCLLSHHTKQLYYIVPENFIHLSKTLSKLLGCFIVVPSHFSIEKRIELAKRYQESGAACCIVLEDNFGLKHFEEKPFLKGLFRKDKTQFAYVDFDKREQDRVNLIFSTLS